MLPTELSWNVQVTTEPHHLHPDAAGERLRKPVPPEEWAASLEMDRLLQCLQVYLPLSPRPPGGSISLLRLAPAVGGLMCKQACCWPRSLVHALAELVRALSPSREDSSR